ncbi:unnamed protein product [Paramecium sonneborni]|uniref:GOLD domain-containing protein n=1 Tax=Paramecium sonneborni TaxID=65129 RepID=A0A8S1KVU8_9CILI|nr:unnamed protein product [Paramecium sonneborni]
MKLFLIFIISVYCKLSQNETNNNTTDHEERKQLMDDWEGQMADFIPDDMLSFELKKGEVEILEQYIKHPTNIRGAFFLSIMNKDKIDFSIKDPRGKVIDNKNQKKEAVFSVNITNPGNYKFVFSNINGKHNHIVTFALDVRNATYEHIKETDLDPIQKKLSSLYTGLNDLMFDTKFSQQKREGGYQFLRDNNSMYFIYTIIETLIILIVSIWQVFYIKRIIGVQRKFV